MRGRRLARIAGPLLAAGVVLLGEGTSDPLPWRMGGVVLWMGLWWLSEAVSLSITALLPLVLFPVLGIPPGLRIAEAYANSTVFLFLGGFLLGAALQRWGVHERLALLMMSRFARRSHHVVGGLLLVVAFLSMWMSNTATALVALPMVFSILKQIPESPSKSRFARQLLLGVAYGASIGGVATIVGTPPNGILIGYLRDHHPELVPSFGMWMRWGLPIAVLMLLATYGVLRILFPYREEELHYDPDLLRRRLRAFPPWSEAERVVLGVFMLTALLWLTRTGLGPWPGWESWLPEGVRVDDTTVVLLLTLILFLWPVRDREGRRGYVLEGDWSRFVAWDVLLLFGGGFALGRGIETTGLDRLVSLWLEGAVHWPPLAVLVASAAIALLFTEFASNTATAAVLVPLLAALAKGIGLSPLELALPATLASSLGFMMPAGTPPNALVFASGQLRVADMVRAGLWLDLIGVLVLVLVIGVFL